jgi:hypothetical protein
MMRNMVVSIVMAALLLPLTVAAMVTLVTDTFSRQLMEMAWRAMMSARRMYQEATENL